jgi:hypothetical protein
MSPQVANCHGELGYEESQSLEDFCFVLFTVYQRSCHTPAKVE